MPDRSRRRRGPDAPRKPSPRGPAVRPAVARVPANAVTVVNVVSTAYCGSTWLSLVLGSNPQCFAVGDMKSIWEQGQVICSVHGPDCPLWSQFDISANENPFLQIARITGKRILIAQSSRRLMDKQDHPQIRSKLLHLTRDGLAVASCYMRDHPGRSMWHAASQWAHTVRHNLKIIDQHQRLERANIAYEDLCEQPEKYMALACDFLGIEYDDAMLDYWNFPHHVLGGNRELVAILSGAQADAQGSVEVAEDQGAGQEPAPAAEEYDEPTPDDADDWQRRVTTLQRLAFAFAAGKWNRALGYRGSMSRR